MYIIVMISFVVHNNGSVDSMQAEKNLMEISKFDKNKTVTKVQQPPLLKI